MGSDEVRRRAQQVQKMGDEVRRSADRLRSAAQLGRRSVVVAAFQRRLIQESARVRVVAADLDTAAVALFRHALAIDGLIGRLAGGRLP
jgi:hypothetical protein